MSIRYLSGINVDNNVLVVDSANDRVGIGTDSPATKLHVSGGDAIIRNGFIGLIPSYGVNYASFSHTSRSAAGEYSFLSGNAGDSYVNSANGQPIYFRHNNNDNVVFTADGKVGIGTTAPITNLHVQGTNTEQVLISYDSTKRMLLGRTAGYGWIAPYTNGVSYDNLVLARDGGNVGIGTTGPSSPLHVYGANNTTPLRVQAGSNANYYFSGNSTSGYQVDFLINDTAFYIGHNSASRDFTFKTNSTDRVTIKGNGNVGIGTASPGYKLEVSGNSYFSGLAWFRQDAGNGSAFRWGLYGTAVSSDTMLAMNQLWNGSGWTILSSAVGTTYLNLGGAVSSPSIDFGTGAQNTEATTKMRITNGGNVLIGTTTDSGYKLDVAGQARFGSGSKAIVGTDGTYSSYSTVGFGGTTNGYNRVFGFDGTSDGLYLASATGHGITFRVNGGSTDNVYINSSGNVGIGTGAPYGRLELYGSGQSWTTAPAIRMWDSFNEKGWLVGNVNNITPGDFYIRTLPSVSGAPGTGQQEFTIKHATGNVLIGTTTDAGNKLDVVTGADGSVLRLLAAAGNQTYFGFDSIGGYIETNGASTGRQRLRLQSYNGSAYTQLFIDGGNQYIYTSSNVNVGIGTTAPSARLDLGSGYGASGEKFLIYNDDSSSALAGTKVGFYMDRFSLSNNSTFVFPTDSSYPGSYIIASKNTSSTTLVARVTVLGESGNVGIGTTSPASVGSYRVLDIQGSSGGMMYLSSNGLDGGRIYGNSGGLTYDATAANHIWYTPGGERMRISSAGNVGIGTTAPDTPLSSARGIVINSGASNDVQIRMQNNGTGSAGSDGGLLSISGSQMYLWNYEASNLIFGTNNSERMRIDSSGNIGIGTTSISYRVDISGDARILSGSLGVGVAPNATDGRIDASNDIVAYSTSDQRLKENVTPIENALEKVKTLTGVEFDWKEETAHVHGYHGHDVGIIAQDVQAVLPEAVRTNDSGYLSVRYEKMIALLIEANKEQQNQIDELKAKLDGLTK
jgi:hypothetical protein